VTNRGVCAKTEFCSPTVVQYSTFLPPLDLAFEREMLGNLETACVHEQLPSPAAAAPICDGQMRNRAVIIGPERILACRFGGRAHVGRVRMYVISCGLISNLPEPEVVRAAGRSLELSALPRLVFAGACTSCGRRSEPVRPQRR